jgi:hypothetical protein
MPHPAAGPLARPSAPATIGSGSGSSSSSSNSNNNTKGTYPFLPSASAAASTKATMTTTAAIRGNSSTSSSASSGAPGSVEGARVGGGVAWGYLPSEDVYDSRVGAYGAGQSQQRAAATAPLGKRPRNEKAGAAPPAAERDSKPER